LSFTVDDGFGTVKQFFIVFEGRLGDEDGAVAGSSVSPAEFLEKWDRGLTGNHPWAHSTQTTLLGVNYNNGVSNNQVLEGRLVKDNNRVANNGNARFNSSLIGPLIRNGTLIRDFQDVLPVPVTSRTQIQLKMDSRINDQPNCAPQGTQGTCAWQVLEFEFQVIVTSRLHQRGKDIRSRGAGPKPPT
jgi:hypothetical protein